MSKDVNLLEAPPNPLLKTVNVHKALIVHIDSLEFIGLNLDKLIKIGLAPLRLVGFM